MLEPGICIGSVRQRSDLQQKNHHKPGDENAADLPQNKFQVRPSCQPPPGGDMRAIPARMVLGVSGGLLCVAHLVCRLLLEKKSLVDLPPRSMSSTSVGRAEAIAGPIVSAFRSAPGPLGVVSP